MSARPRLTPHQKEYLNALTRRQRWAPKTEGGYILAASIGGKRVWYYLHAKGYIDIADGIGPRGGHHLLVRLREI